MSEYLSENQSPVKSLNCPPDVDGSGRLLPENPGQSNPGQIPETEITVLLATRQAMLEKDRIIADLRQRVAELEAAQKLSAEIEEDRDICKARLRQLEAERAWRPIAEALQDGTHYHVLNRETTRTYSPARYWLGRWEYWNEITGVWERCGKQPTHYRLIPDVPKNQEGE